ncbi:DNA-binding protein [Bifidobacterium tsurumiense]|nr:DNA-binding protein [Bifidobacterium tsurumiense]MDY4678148.1 DNA-binding protein [Bifidobacterium tsurumiense]MSS13187.1 DNA-binding protein [Bifidobacterium tsurumiense]
MTENQTDNIANNQPQFLDVSDLQTMFGVGRSKARLMMDALPSIRVGRKDYVTATVLNTFIAENSGIPIKWPKCKR